MDTEDSQRVAVDLYRLRLEPCDRLQLRSTRDGRGKTRFPEAPEPYTAETLIAA
jgi:hypothetical protein